MENVTKFGEVIKGSDEIIIKLVEVIRHSLRDKKCESVYVTSKQSGLRPDVINRIERGEGSLRHASTYVESFCRRFPAEGRNLFYNMCMLSVDRYVV